MENDITWGPTLVCKELMLMALKMHMLFVLFQEAKYHMKRCIDSGLWVPNTRAAEGAEKGEKTDSAFEELKKESCEEDKESV